MLPPFRACVRSASTTIELSMPPYAGKNYPSGPRKIRANCRSAYAARSLDEVEREIAAFVESMVPKKNPNRAPRTKQETDLDVTPWTG